MGAAWNAVVDRFGNNRPPVFRDKNPLYGTALTRRRDPRRDGLHS